MGQRKITWSPDARRDLREVWDYIRADNRTAGRHWREGVLKRVAKLAQFPQMGRMIPEIGVSRYRELVVGDYRILHEATKTEVRIFGVLHSKRLFPYAGY